MTKTAQPVAVACNNGAPLQIYGNPKVPKMNSDGHTVFASAADVNTLRRRLTVSDQIRFDDGAAYERYMGEWSRLAGETFLDWLAPKSGLRWLHVGCGNGAFTEMLVERCVPLSVQGIDPSEGQLAYARTRPASRVAQFRQGDAMALPFPDHVFDAAVMPLVIFFVPDPTKGVTEMA